jgi:hypothetical protein
MIDPYVANASLDLLGTDSQDDELIEPHCETSNLILRHCKRSTERHCERSVAI